MNSRLQRTLKVFCLEARAPLTVSVALPASDSRCFASLGGTCDLAHRLPEGYWSPFT